MIRLFVLSLLVFPCFASEATPTALGDDQLTAEQRAEISDGDTVVGVYDEAVATLEKICEDYRRIKALQLAKQRDIAFEDAYENISSVMPLLKPINRQLLRKKIYDPDEIVPHKREVEKVESEVLMMVELATKLLLEIEVMEAQQAQQEQQQEITLQELVQREQFDPEEQIEQSGEEREQQDQQLEELAEAAKEEQEEQAKDLTPIMRQLMPDIQDLTSEETSEEQVKMELFTSSSDVNNVMGKMDLNTVNKTVGRRVVQEGGEPVEWMFIDTWYTIGPFPNPHRMNLHRKFPPETVVDLSATYIGKSDKTIKWEFLQSNQARCVPNHDEEYAIYYAYTELWMDQPMDLWIAIGSDDKANVWLNDMPVWISGDQLKGWKVNEGFRKVTFKAGVNKILYRVENGHFGTAFSLGIKVAP